jgi:hypothetical protein
MLQMKVSDSDPGPWASQCPRNSDDGNRTELHPRKRRRDMTGVNPQNTTAPSSKVDWIAIAVSIAALVASTLSIILSYHAQQQANAISRENTKLQQENIRLQESVQAQSSAAAERNRAAEVSVEILSGTVKDVIVSNASNSQIGNIVVVFLSANWAALPASTRYPDGILYLGNMPSCSQDLIPFSVTLSKNKIVYLPGPDNAVLYFTDPDGNYWTTDQSGTLSKVNEVRAPKVPYRTAAQDITSDFKPNISQSGLSSCG